MRRAVLIIGKNVNLNNYDFTDAYVIGVDKGAYLAYQSGIRLDAAIGDFDSISKKDYEKLLSYTKVTTLNPIKDETDTLEALEMVKGYDQIVLLGAIQGKRIEHFYSNLLLLKENPKVIMIDDNSIIYTRDKSFTLKKDQYQYTSFYSFAEESIISLNGFKYNINDYHLKEIDHLCVSNEVTSDIASVEIKKGRILVIQSLGDNNEEIL